MISFALAFCISNLAKHNVFDKSDVPGVAMTFILTGIIDFGIFCLVFPDVFYRAM